MTYSLLKSSGTVWLSLLFLFSVYTKSVQGQIHVDSGVTSTPNSTYSASQNFIQPVEGTLNIIGVMVEFQPDDNRFTSGNGTFEPGSITYLENPGTNIDALPHDHNYFEAHLEFVKNYFESQSNGRLQIQYQVLPTVFRLDKEMAEYSPIGENPELTPLASMAHDVWEKVSAAGELPIHLNSYQNTAFVIFHAGVGRDIELTGTTLDRTPQDIPSVYLSTNALRNLLGDPSFSGFEIDNGNLLVNNTLILPRTLSRSGEDITGERFVLPLSTNGMITAQIASHLGLPDLFNTETGESGIGRFGLMDGAGIFSFNGLFPPGLSAWEKLFLGWAEPVELSYDQQAPVTLPAASFNMENSIARISVSGSEFFLVENRHRDPDNTGVTLTIRRPDGTETEQTFTNKDEDFINRSAGFDALLEPGVVVNVSNFDFSLPGGFDPGDANSSERDLNGGILIWHIDETVIRQKLGHAGINSNPIRRGVNLQEADGAQDIGRQTTIGLFQNEANGSAFDFWWSGNNATVITQTDSLVLYQNRFGPDTIPNNRTNSGAPSYFELYDFSDNLPFATFRIRPANPFSQLYTVVDERSDLVFSTFTEAEDPYHSRYPLALQPIHLDETSFLLIPGSNGVQFYNVENQQMLGSTLSSPTLQQPFVGHSTPYLAIAQNPNQATEHLEVEIFTFNGENVEAFWEFESPLNSGFISSSEKSILDIDGTNTRANVELQTIVETPYAAQRSEIIRGFQSKIENNRIIITTPSGESISHTLPGNVSEFRRNHTGIIDNSGSEILFYLLTDGRLSLFSETNNFSDELIITNRGFISWPSITDFTRDGNPDFLFTDHEGNLLAKNRYGAVLPDFPIHPPVGVQFIGTPLIADLNGNGEPEILITGQDQYSMNVYAYTPEGIPLEGFPLHIGGVSDTRNEPIHPVLIGNKLAAVSHNGDLKIWEFSSIGEVYWASRYGNSTTNNVSAKLSTEHTPVINFTLLNADETYNWPNPAVDETNIRFQTSSPADISLKITTMSGRLIFNHRYQSRGLLPEEIRIDTSSWASGGYFALLEASNGNHTERKMIKIAIIR